MLTKRSLCCRKYDFDVTPCLYLLNEAHAALIRFLISAASCRWHVIVCPRYFALSHADKISTLMLLIFISFLLCELWLLRTFRLVPVDFQSYPLGTLLEVTHLFLKLHLQCRVREHVVSRTKVCEAVRLRTTQAFANAICLFANVSRRLSVPYGVQCWGVSWTLDHPVFVLLFYLEYVTYLVFLWSAFYLLKRLKYGDSIPHFSSASHGDSWLIESNASMKVHCRDPHFDSHFRHFCSSSLHVARWSSVLYERRNPPWSSGCARSSLS